MTVEQLARLLPHIPITELVLPGVAQNRDAVTHVEINHPEYLLQVDAIIRAIPEESLLAYLHWQAFRQTDTLWDVPWKTSWDNFMGEVYKRVSKMYERNGRATNSVKQENVSADMRCARHTMDTFGFILDSFFVREKLSSGAITRAETMFGNVKKAARNMMRKTRWLSNGTREAAVNKIEMMNVTIGYQENVSTITNSRRLHTNKRRNSMLSTHQQWPTFTTAHKLLTVMQTTSL